MGAIYLVRHGQASFGKADYDKLSETGIEQARVLGRALRGRLPQVDAVYAGAMKRHRQTAEHCLETFGAERDISVLPGLNEFDHDEVIVRHKPLYANRLLMMADLGRTLEPRRAFQRVFEEATARWISGKHDAEYRETWPAFRARCVAALTGMAASAGAAQQVLAFTSGGPITAICQHLLHIPDAHVFDLNRTLTNAGVTKVICSTRGLYLSTVNEHAHFEGAYRDLITYR